MNKTLSLILHIISAVLSVILSVALLFSFLGATLIGVGREYLTSGEFNSLIDNMDLPGLTFTKDGEKLTLKEYAQSYAEEYTEKYIQENTKTPLFSLDDFSLGDFPLGDFSLSDITNSITDSIKDIFSIDEFSVTDYAVDKFLNSKVIETAIKTEVHSIIDYFLYSDPDEARERLDNGITLQNNPELNVDNAETFEEKISIKIKLFVLEFIESTTGVSCDKIIILLSEETALKLKNISLGLSIALIIVNIRNIFNAFAYLGAVSLTYSGVITLVQNKFEEFHQGKQDLVSYKFLKPLLDTYTPYSQKALTYGLVLLALFILAIIILVIIKKKKKVGDD